MRVGKCHRLRHRALSVAPFPNGSRPGAQVLPLGSPLEACSTVAQRAPRPADLPHPPDDPSLRSARLRSLARLHSSCARRSGVAPVIVGPRRSRVATHTHEPPCGCSLLAAPNFPASSRLRLFPAVAHVTAVAPASNHKAPRSKLTADEKARLDSLRSALTIPSLCSVRVKLFAVGGHIARRSCGAFA